MPGGPWARGWPAELSAPGLGRKENLSLSGRQSGARQPDQSKAGSRARAARNRATTKGGRGRGSAGWAQPGGLSALTR